MLQVKWYDTAPWCLFAVEEEMSKVSLEFSSWDVYWGLDIYI